MIHFHIWRSYEPSSWDAHTYLCQNFPYISYNPGPIQLSCEPLHLLVPPLTSLPLECYSNKAMTTAHCATGGATVWENRDVCVHREGYVSLFAQRCEVFKGQCHMHLWHGAYEVPSPLVLKIETINDYHNELSVACTCSEEVFSNILCSDHLLNIKLVSTSWWVCDVEIMICNNVTFL